MVNPTPTTGVVIHQLTDAEAAAEQQRLANTEWEHWAPEDHRTEGANRANTNDPYRHPLGDARTNNDDPNQCPQGDAGGTSQAGAQADGQHYNPDAL